MDPNQAGQSYMFAGMGDPSAGGNAENPGLALDNIWKQVGDDSNRQMFSFMQQQAQQQAQHQAAAASAVAAATNASPAAAAAESKDKSAVKRATKTGSASKASSKSKKTRNSLTEAEKIARREKHNQVEIRRRKRINQRFNELGDICGCDSKQKRNILTSAIDKLKEFEDRIQQLKGNLESLALDDVAGDPSDAVESAEEKLEGDGQFQDHSVVDHRSVFMKSGVPLHVSGFDGRILDCNEKFAQLFGFTREVILANQVTVFSLTSPDSLAVTFGVVGHLMKGNPRAQVDNLMIGPGGRLIKVKVTAWLIRDNGRPKYFMSMMVPDPNFQAPAGNVAALPQAGANVNSLQVSGFLPNAPNNQQLAAISQLPYQNSLQGNNTLSMLQQLTNPAGAQPSGALGALGALAQPLGMRGASGQHNVPNPAASGDMRSVITPPPQQNVSQQQLQQLQQQLQQQQQLQNYQLHLSMLQQQQQQQQQQQPGTQLPGKGKPAGGAPPNR